MRRRVSEDDHQFIREISLRVIIFDFDLACIENTCLEQTSFHKLCDMLRIVGGLSSVKNMCVEEMVAMFLHICAHHVKNRVIKRQFVRCGKTVSRHFTIVLKFILLCYELSLKKSKPFQKIQLITNGSGLSYYDIAWEVFILFCQLWKYYINYIHFLF